MCASPTLRRVACGFWFGLVRKDFAGGVEIAIWPCRGWAAVLEQLVAQVTDGCTGAAHDLHRAAAARQS
jgi:hypothetical protein